MIKREQKLINCVLSFIMSKANGVPVQSINSGVKRNNKVANLFVTVTTVVAFEAFSPTPNKSISDYSVLMSSLLFQFLSVFSCVA